MASFRRDGDIIHFGGFGMGKTPLHRKVALPLKSDVAYILRYGTTTFSAFSNDLT